MEPMLKWAMGWNIYNLVSAEYTRRFFSVRLKYAWNYSIKPDEQGWGVYLGAGVRTEGEITPRQSALGGSVRFKYQLVDREYWLRPYLAECTPSRPIWEVKLLWAGLVLWLGTTREYPVL